MRGLKTLLNSIHGFCTDAGTDMSIGDVAGIKINDVLPDWMQDPLAESQEASDIEYLDVNHQLPAQAQALPASVEEFLFPHSIISPRALHILHNMSAEVDSGFQFYDNWLLSFKPLVRLLHADHLRNRFLGTCVVDRLAWMKPHLCKTSGACVVEMGHCRSRVAAFNENRGSAASCVGSKFSRQDESGMDCELDVNAVTAAVRSDKFLLYSSMLLQLHALTLP